MADDHLVMLPSVALRRSEALKRVATVLVDHGFTFDGGARALHWDAELDSFAYDDEDDRDLEGLGSIEAALAVSVDWERICLDFQGISSNWELHASRGPTPDECTVALSFPHSLYRLCSAEVQTARQLLFVLNDVREVLSVEQLACGTETPTPGWSARQLDHFIQTQLQAHSGPTPTMHTLLLTRARERQLRNTLALGDAWHSFDLTTEAVALSQLRVQ